LPRSDVLAAEWCPVAPANGSVRATHPDPLGTVFTVLDGWNVPPVIVAGALIDHDAATPAGGDGLQRSRVAAVIDIEQKPELPGLERQYGT
jgi:hypothetical protein